MQINKHFVGSHKFLIALFVIIYVLTVLILILVIPKSRTVPTSTPIKTSDTIISCQVVDRNLNTTRASEKYQLSTLRPLETRLAYWPIFSGTAFYAEKLFNGNYPFTVSFFQENVDFIAKTFIDPIRLSADGKLHIENDWQSSNFTLDRTSGVGIGNYIYLLSARRCSVSYDACYQRFFKIDPTKGSTEEIEIPSTYSPVVSITSNGSNIAEINTNRQCGISGIEDSKIALDCISYKRDRDVSVLYDTVTQEWREVTDSAALQKINNINDHNPECITYKTNLGDFVMMKDRIGTGQSRWLDIYLYKK